jgi:hypothetical protein
MKIQNALPVFIALCLSSTALPFHTPIEGERIKVPGIFFKLCFLFWSFDGAYR